MSTSSQQRDGRGAASAFASNRVVATGDSWTPRSWRRMRVRLLDSSMSNATPTF